jgi:hypothetical protein
MEKALTLNAGVHEDIVRMMRKGNIEAYSKKRPFEPFEVRLVDGQRFRVRGMEEFMLGPYHMAVFDSKRTIVTVSLGLIATIRPLGRGRSPGRRQPRSR